MKYTNIIKLDILELEIMRSFVKASSRNDIFSWADSLDWRVKTVYVDQLDHHALGIVLFFFSLRILVKTVRQSNMESDFDNLLFSAYQFPRKILWYFVNDTMYAVKTEERTKIMFAI